MAASDSRPEKVSLFWPTGLASRMVPTSPVWHSGGEKKSDEEKTTRQTLLPLLGRLVLTHPGKYVIKPRPGHGKRKDTQTQPSE